MKMMMRHTQAILAKFCGRTVAEAQHAWKTRDGLVLGAAFICGYVVQLGHVYYQRRQFWNKVGAKRVETAIRLEELYHRVMIGNEQPSWVKLQSQIGEMEKDPIWQQLFAEMEEEEEEGTPSS